MNETCQQQTSETNFLWWTEGLVGILVGLTGLVGNTIAIPILLSKELMSIFNRMLVCLAIFDNVFIVCTLSEAIRRHFYTSDAQMISFIHIFYPLQNISVVCSTYLTIGLAMERWFAVSKPVEYHLSVNGGGVKPWRRVAMYVASILAFSIAFNLPKFFEVRSKEEFLYNQSRYDPIHQTYTVVNVTKFDFVLTDIRTNEDYVFYYVNLSRLIVTGIIPLFSLSYLNTSIYRHIKRRGGTNLSGSHGGSSQRLAEENRAAVVLLFIVIMFLVCSIPRIILNLYEVIKLKMLRAVVSNKCYYLPFWVMCLSSSSILLLIMNSSINFFVYCLVNTSFRREFYGRINGIKARISRSKNGLQSFCFPQTESGNEYHSNLCEDREISRVAMGLHPENIKVLQADGSNKAITTSL